jgi:ornithine cyclodeaminase
MRFLDADDVAALGYAGAVDAVLAALRSGLDPGLDVPRIPVDLVNGQFLLMPSQTPSEVTSGVLPDGRGAAGVKVVTVAPGNPSRGLPRIQAVYLLFDADTLGLRAVLDGTALTTLRTPAVSVAAVLDRLPDRPLRLVVLGTGPQATGHAAAFAAVRRVHRTTYLARSPARTSLDAVQLGSSDAETALADADVVVCATSARDPLFDSSILRDDVIVVAVGSHEPDARELDESLLARATVVVEDVATALREAGDVVVAIDRGALAAGDLVTLRDHVAGTAETAGATGRADTAVRPLVFKGVGMSWEDLVVAAAVAHGSGA